MIFDKFVFRRMSAYNKLKDYDLNECISNTGLRHKCLMEVICYEDGGLYPIPCYVQDVLVYTENYTYKQLLKTIEIIEKYIDLDRAAKE